MAQEFKIGAKESKKNNFGRRQVEVSLLRTVLERAHKEKSESMSQEFNPKDLDSEDLYSEDDISTVSEEVVTSTNGKMIFEIEDPLEEQKAKKAKISDEKMFEKFFLD